ncbi:hypothetical protein K469DRAFT_594633 [Zopfia rhizophila CBS 207.26]|uniref:Uncharacterized protein n=1 Tax=Zopfia rhizophila CBS 207.26 TaxID=1314779 RepID=A0A6A6DJT0_9PEZI|nr:hypothetical protein K469DRAFT_594633 [Zopfia rhizophila CBS 207.26]
MRLYLIISLFLNYQHVLPLPQTAPYLTATALVAKNGNTAFECWLLTKPFERPSLSGLNGAQVANIGNFTNLSYSIMPPRWDGNGLHNSPALQLVHYLSGVAHVTLPHNSVEAWIKGGVEGLLFATDTTGTGHFTKYPTNEETVVIMAPFKDRKGPDHIILANRPCNKQQKFPQGS